MRALVLILLVVSCKPDMETCKKACLNFAKLSHYEKFEQQSKDLGPVATEELKKKFDEEWATLEARGDDDKGRHNCAVQCRTDGRRDDAQCMVKATTAAAARACIGQ